MFWINSRLYSPFTNHVGLELSFPEGAKITHLEFPDEDWWYGQYKGELGLFPANYVQLDE
jgi:hypothetical protein